MQLRFRWRAPRLSCASSVGGRHTVIVACLSLGACAVAGLMLGQLHRDTREQAVIGAGNLLSVTSLEIARTIRQYDLSLQAVADGMRLPALNMLPGRIQDLLLYDRAASAEGYGPIVVVDAKGHAVRASRSTPLLRQDYGATDYFEAQRGRDAGLFISRPFRAGPGGGFVIAISRRIGRDDGGFGGIVFGTLSLDHLRVLFAAARLGPHGAMNLFRADGVRLLREPWRDGGIGEDIGGSTTFRRFVAQGAGTLEAVSVLDHVDRIYSFTRVDGLPLILDVALAEQDVFAVWRQRAGIIGAVLVLSFGLAALLDLQLRRELARRARDEERLQRSEARYRLLADHIGDVIMQLDSGLRRTYVSPSCLGVLGYAAQELLGRRPQEIIHPEDWAPMPALLEAARGSLAPVEAVYRVRHKDGHEVWIEGRYSFVAADQGFVVALRDISARKAADRQLKAANTELMHLATHDALTGLANRRRFDEMLSVELRRAAREQTALSLLLLDVDHFKRFNDRYGHQCGDDCLRLVAAAVSLAARRSSDLVARYGGEELVVLLPVTDEAGALRVAERMRREVERLAIAHEDGGSGGLVTVSIGCATGYPQPGDGASMPDAALFGLADARLYAAKAGGRNRVVSSAGVSRALLEARAAG